MTTLFKEPDFDAIQLLYGFTLLAIAIVIAVSLVGNVYMLTAAVCLLLIKDGMPNFVVGCMNLGKNKEKK
jgi:hypothetical protein